MSKEREKELKPLSFSTTIRNPDRIIDFLNCILEYEGKILTNQLIYEIVKNILRKKVYKPQYINSNIELKNIYNSEEIFTEEQLDEIIINSEQRHKEKDFDKGWPSRFDTWYKLTKELGFIYYRMGEQIIISSTGHMLINAMNNDNPDNQKKQDIFLNAMMKYQTNNPFRKNKMSNSPLILLLNTIKLLKEDNKENNAGIFRNEIPLLICWKNDDYHSLYQLIKRIRQQYKYNYGDEIIYEICLSLLGANKEKNAKRFKITQITNEAVDDFIRKMRITGVISLRGNGRFIDFNTFKINTINYILQNYSQYKTFTDEKEFFKYMGNIDSNILRSYKIDVNKINNIKISELNKWAQEYTKEYIINELKILSKKQETKNNVLKFINKPTRLEFLTSIYLKQNFKTLKIYPNYSVDDEGLPTFTATGNMADIECFDIDSNQLIEVTLISSRNQSIVEVPAIKRHLEESIKKFNNNKTFSILVAPIIHEDTKLLVGYIKYQHKLTIIPLTITEFISKLQQCQNISEILNVIFS